MMRMCTWLPVSHLDEHRESKAKGVATYMCSFVCHCLRVYMRLHVRGFFGFRSSGPSPAFPLLLVVSVCFCLLPPVLVLFLWGFVL